MRLQKQCLRLADEGFEVATKDRRFEIWKYQSWAKKTRIVLSLILIGWPHEFAC